MDPRAQRPDMRLVVMSATLDAGKFPQYFIFNLCLQYCATIVTVPQS